MLLSSAPKSSLLCLEIQIMLIGTVKFKTLKLYSDTMIPDLSNFFDFVSTFTLILHIIVNIVTANSLEISSMVSKC